MQKFIGMDVREELAWQIAEEWVDQDQKRAQEGQLLSHIEHVAQPIARDGKQLLDELL